LSILTKALIVLLAVASLFLCGIVVTYVATTNNYKKAYDELSSEIKVLKKKVAGIKEQLNDKIRAMENLSDRLNGSVELLKSEKQRLEQELKSVKSDRIALEGRINNLAAAALKFEETVGGMENSLKQTRAQLDLSRAEEIKLNKDVGELTAALTEKLAQLEAMGIEQKRLLEEKDKLEKQLAGNLEPGTGPDEITLVTQTKDPARRTEQRVVSEESSLQGLVTAIDGPLATISIGAADGVVSCMIFHVIRDDASDPFICDIRISDVDDEVAAGTLQVIQSQPRVGDRVSTTW